VSASALRRWTRPLARLVRGPVRLETVVGDLGPTGPLGVPSGGDGVWEIRRVGGRPCLAPSESSHYVYFTLPTDELVEAPNGIWLEVEYYGSRYAEFRVQYASKDHTAEFGGLYKAAEQRWDGDGAGLRRFRRALFPMPDFSPAARQNLDASFRIEFRREVLVSRLTVTTAPPDPERFPEAAPLPELRKMPGRFYPINYFFIEITNACNFKCTWCPDSIMDRRRGFMRKEKAFRILDEIAEKKAWLGPLYPVKLHQMGEPMLHPDLPEIVGHAESRGVGIELNTNCGLITRERIDALYEAGLTNLILSYQTPDADSFRTRKAPKLLFDDYRDRVRLAVERKVAMKARTRLEIDVMNTKYADGYRIVSEDEQAVAFLEEWIGFARELESKYGIAPRVHDLGQIRSASFLDQDENGSRYTILDGVELIWKRCHTWGNVIGGHLASGVVDTYCPAPYDQFVVQWNGDVVSCCTDYEGRTKTANVFTSSIEAIWRSDTVRKRREDMLAGRLLDVCARCEGVK